MWSNHTAFGGTGSDRERNLTTMQTHRSAAVKKPRNLPKPKSGPVTTTILPSDLREYLVKYGNRVEVVNSTTIIVWNSVAQRDAMKGKGR
jgi:hypothetical protein